MSDIQEQHETEASAPILNDMQWRGLIERFAIYAVAFTLGRYISPELQEGIVSVLVPLAMAGISAIGGYWFNRNSALVVASATLPDVKTVVMTTKAGANAIPLSNVIPPMVFKTPEPTIPPKRRRR